MSILVPPAIGYYISQSPEPLYDPWPALCPFCTEELTDDNVRSFNLMQIEREPHLSVFYRTHKSCHENASAQDKQNLDEVVMAVLEAIANQKGDEQ